MADGVSGAKDALATARERCMNSVRFVAGAVRDRWPDLGRGAAPDEDVLRAWTELREHPELKWVPPMWRPQAGASTQPIGGVSEIDVDRVVVRAVERNLVIEIVNTTRDGMCVRLSTSPLQDRRVGDGVDPTTPAVCADRKVGAMAPTFEQAIVKLRNAVVEEYGPLLSTHKTDESIHVPVPPVGDFAVTAARKTAGKVSRPLHVAR